MSTARWRVSFETVSPFDWPQGYGADHTSDCFEHPTRPVSEVPEGAWHRFERETDDEANARAQIEGLRELVADGEFVRNIKLERVGAIDWQEVTP